MIANDLGNKRKAKPRAITFRGDEGIKQAGLEIVGNARPVIDDADFEGQMDPSLRPGTASRRPWR